MTALTALAACGGRLSDVRGVDSKITDIELVGVERFAKDELLAYLNIDESPLLPIDAERIVELYSAVGYYDAEVLSIIPDTTLGRVRRLGKRKGERRLGKTTIRIHVREGEPTPIRSVELRWGDEGRETPPLMTEPQARATAGQRVGEPFEVEAFSAGALALRHSLRERGHAFAAVDEAAEVNVGAGVDVDYRIHPGPTVRIGEVIIDGLVRVPERYVRTEIDFVDGRAYSPGLLKEVESAIYGMGVFQSVTVEVRRPKAIPAGGEVVADLRVVVAEAPTQSIKVGPGLGIDPVRWEQRAQLLYRHRNVGRNLTRFELKALAGYAELPALYRPETHGPLFDFEPSFTQKGFLEKRTTWRLAPHFQLGIWEGYQFYSPELRMGPERFFTKYFQLGVTYNLRFVDFFNVDPALNEDSSILGRDFRDPYLISYFEPRATVYLVDSILKPKNGAILSATYNIAGAGGDFAFHKIQPEVRAYYTPHKRVTLAGRASVGFIYPFDGERGGAPIDMNFYLGGADTVRGWGMRRLAPKVLTGGCEMVSQECRGLPVGGQSMFFTNAELRVELVKNVRGVAFFDVGDVREGVQTITPENWAMSVGPGVRYVSPIGTFRLDAGIRLNETDRSLGERGWAIHLGLGEAF